MQRQLFDTTLAERREAFVRARLAEPTMFGRADILEWLADPEWTGIIDFDRAPAIVEHSTEAWGDLAPTLATLLGFGTPGDQIPDWMLGRVSRKAAYATIVSGLVACGFKVYYPWVNDLGVYPLAVSADGTSVLRITHDAGGEHAIAFQTASVRDVLEAITAEIKRNGPKKDAAMALVNRTARHAVANVRKAAVRDFDDAVAVSDDGTKIVAAKWVIVVPAAPNEPATLYPAEAFRANKIRRQPNRVSGSAEGFVRLQINTLSVLIAPASGMNADTPAFDVCAAGFRRSRDLGTFSQLMLRFSEEAAPGIESIFVVTPDDCPSPLPAGGRTLAV